MANNSQSKGMSDFLMKVMSLILAIMVWFIIKTAAGLSYSNAEPSRRPSDSETSAPPLSNPDALKENNGTDSE